jgi:endoglucanase
MALQIYKCIRSKISLSLKHDVPVYLSSMIEVYEGRLKMFSKYIQLLATAFFLCLCSTLCLGDIEIKPEGYFETPGFAFLVYHNDYLVGKRGGLQMFLHGTRVMDAGEVVCSTGLGPLLDFTAKEVGERTVDTNNRSSTIRGKIIPVEIDYSLKCHTDGKSIFLTVELDKSLDWTKIANFMLKFEIYPNEYKGKTYRGEDSLDHFPDRFMGKEMLIPKAMRIQIAPEDNLRSFTIEAEENCILSLIDSRGRANHAGYTVFVTLNHRSSSKRFAVKITPLIDPNWRRNPVIQVSQLGYRPTQRKQAVLEMDPRITPIEKMILSRLAEDGEKIIVKETQPKRWGELFDFTYYTFDFTEIKEPGQYFVRYKNQEAGPILIHPDVYKEAWHPTMDVFFPVQMCHVEVWKGEQIWHGACHLDDGIQAPPNTEHFDSYRQKAETETPFKANDHIPGLDWGGWHDAADFDLPFGSIAWTVLWMALAHEEFGAPRDRTTINRNLRRVDLFRPDRKDDMLQQIAFGMEFLLALYRSTGHVSPGIIENKILDYIVVGDPVNITDGLIYDPDLKADEKKDGRSGKFDDRWVFTNRNTGGQYQFAQVSAIASRVLGGFDDNLAAQCLKAAEDVWAYEQSHDPVRYGVSYQPQEDEYHSWELTAAAELYLTTGKAVYKDRLLALVPSVKDMSGLDFWQVSGFTLVRALSEVEDSTYTAIITEKLKDVKKYMEEEFSKSPYRVYFNFKIWGNNWDILDLGARSYFFIKHFPEIIDEECLCSALNYNFGHHPASNHSYVSGIGVNSATVGYGFNRSEWTYIPGGVVSGASFIRPKFIEYRSNAWDWYETEYVIWGSAAYVFDVLAVDFLLGQKKD